MGLKVKHILEHFTVPRLRELCMARDLSVSGQKHELRERLARSYRGDPVPLIQTLTRTELIAVLELMYVDLDGRRATLSRLSQARREDLQHIAIRVFRDLWDPKKVGDEVAPEGCPVRLKWTDPHVVDDGRTQVMSSRHAGAGFAELSVDSLRRELVGARGLSVASAYYDEDFFRNLLLVDGKPGEYLDQVRIVVNGLAGPRLNLQREELSALQADLRRVYRSVDIRLAFAKSIFHPKLYLVRNHGSRVALIGSANATMAAMSVNDEILLRLKESVEGLEAYFEHIWNNEASELDNQVGRIKNLVQFLRSGRLFFRASSAFQMTLNPFGELLRQLPRADRALLTNVRLRNSEPKPGVGPFDLIAAIGLGEAENDEAAIQEDEKHRASIKPYSVETCYGYWVPQALTASFEGALDAAEVVKNSRYERIARALAATPDATITERYGEYVDDAERIFSKVPSVPVILPGLRSDPFKSHEWFQTRVQKLREKLGKEEYIRRLCRPFTDVAVPEIWDDPIALDDFTGSFFEYLAYVSTLPTKSHVPRRIIDWAKCPGETDADAIQKALEEQLGEVGWNDPDDWKM